MAVNVGTLIESRIGIKTTAPPVPVMAETKPVTAPIGPSHPGETARSARAWEACVNEDSPDEKVRTLRMRARTRGGNQSIDHAPMNAKGVAPTNSQAAMSHRTLFRLAKVHRPILPDRMNASMTVDIEARMPMPSP
jgi:hypothetical protein